MINMIKSELYRMTKCKSFYLYWFAIIFTYAISIVTKSAGGIMLGIEVESAGKMDMQMVAMNFTFYFLFLFPVYSIVVSDFGEKTIKNTISSAISRKTYIASKFILTELFTMGSFVFCNIMFYVINSVINGEKYTSAFSEYIKALLRQCPIMFTIVTLLVALGFILRKMALFNAITLLVPTIYTALAVSIYQAGAQKFATEYLLKYELATALGKVAGNVSSNYYNNCIIASCIVVVIAVFVSYNSFMKVEIK